MRQLICLAFAVVSASSWAGWSSAGENTIGFSATGTLGLKIDGSVSKVDIKEDGGALKLTVALKDVETGMGLRNKHMLEDVEAAKFPDIALSIPLETLKLPEDGKSLEAEGKGTWSFHGKTKELPFKYTASAKGGVVSIEATSALNVKDFEVKIRSYMGITVKPDVAIRAKLSLKK